MRAKFALALTCLCACFVFACESQQTNDKPKDPPKVYTDAEKAQLAADVHALLKEQCDDCHQAGAAKIYAKIDYILDHDKLVKSKHVDLEAPEESYLYTEILEGSMPRKFDEDGKPKVKVQLPKEKAELVLNWIRAGAPAWK